MSLQLEKCILGIEFGSTRIKGVLIDEAHRTVASGEHKWKNRIEDSVFVYHLEDAIAGLRNCYGQLRDDVKAKYGQEITTLQAIGISGMMHGYLVFDQSWKQVAPYRSWRNVMTGRACEELMELFHFNIPQRWSIAHLYQAILNQEDHVKDIAVLTTLAGYIHHLLTGRNVVGIDEASGMFPYDEKTGDFDASRIELFDHLVDSYGLSWKLKDILPEVLPAGAQAGILTEGGAALLDDTGSLKPGIPLCPPEGDAGTGMTATGAVTPRTGSVSAGTSSFALLVLEKPLSGYYPEIDVIATPSGKPVAMAHTNNCTSEINVWVSLMSQAMERMGYQSETGKLYEELFNAAMEGEPDCDGCIAYNYLAGEPVSGVETGRPLFFRLPESSMSLPNFMRAQLYGAVATLQMGVALLEEKEHVQTDSLFGHGGFFKTPGVGQQILADALRTDVSVMETAGEGGPWGMALLAAYMARKEDEETLEMYLSEKVFSMVKKETLRPDPEGVNGFTQFIRRYRTGLKAEIALGEVL